MFLPKEVKDILNLDRNLYIVGGFVRDFVLKFKGSKDIDMVFDGDIEDLLPKIEPIAQFNYIKKYFSVSFQLNGYSFTITSSREEVFKDGKCSFRRNSLDRDYLRRDFTINTLMFRDSLIDPSKKGLEDIEKKIIRSVASIDDDPSRAIRAIRFALRFGFKLEKKTKDEVSKVLKNLKVFDEDFPKKRYPRVARELDILKREVLPSFFCYNIVKIL